MTPVKHFFRTASEDYEPRRRRIRAGDNLMMCYWSANHDEEAFQEPDAFRIDRLPNRHLAFGTGVHVFSASGLKPLPIRYTVKA